MDDLKRNGSGYYDPTAYKAIRKFQNGGVTMEVYRGDIFYIEDNYRTEGSEQRPGRPALVVSNNTGNYHSDIVSIVWLTTAEKKPLPTHCNIISRVPSIAICEQGITISQNRLGEYIRTAAEAEMKEVDRCLMIALGLTEKAYVIKNPDASSLELIDDLKMKLEGAERELDEKKKMLNEVQIQLVDANDHIKFLAEQNEEVNHSITERTVIELTVERDLYKAQYEKMLERLIGA